MPMSSGGKTVDIINGLQKSEHTLSLLTKYWCNFHLLNCCQWKVYDIWLQNWLVVLLRALNIVEKAYCSINIACKLSGKQWKLHRIISI